MNTAKPAHQYISYILWVIVMLMLVSQLASAAAPAAPTLEPTYAALADLLENEQSRERLIAELRQLAEKQQNADSVDTSAATPKILPPALGFPRKIADASQTFVNNLASELRNASNGVASLMSDDRHWNWQALATQVLNLGLVATATVGLFLLLRHAERPFLARVDLWACPGTAGNPLWRRFAAALWALFLDFFVIFVAWVGGYSLALFAVGNRGEMDTQTPLFLNAFLMVEIFKTFIRALFASHHDRLRLLPMTAETAAYWNAWLARISGFIGYGMLLVAPFISGALSPALGRVVTLLIMLVAFIYAVLILLQNRASVAHRLQMRADFTRTTTARVALTLLAGLWHWLAIGYFGALVLVTLLRPEDALPLMLRASLQTLLAIGGGTLVSTVLTQIISRRWHLPAETHKRFPLLEQRLNSFVPTALKIMRVIVLWTVIVLVLDAWGLFNLGAWLASEAGVETIRKALTVAVMLIVMTLIWIALASWIEHRLNPLADMEEPSPREKTLLAIFRNAIAVVLSIVTAMTVLAEIGVDIAPLIAGAGVVGLAIGFGSQKLVQDIITGIFIQLENAINTGDVISAAGITGVAEKLTIRSIGIRDLSGTYHLIPFSSVDTVSNFMRDFAYHVGEYGVAYREDTDEVIQRLGEAFNELKADPDYGPLILESLEVQGVTALADSAVNVRVRIKTLPGSQWSVGRAYNRLVKRHLDAAGIEIPYPHLTLYFGQNKDGSAPVAPIRLQQP